MEWEIVEVLKQVAYDYSEDGKIQYYTLALVKVDNKGTTKVRTLYTNSLAECYDLQAGKIYINKGVIK